MFHFVPLVIGVSNTACEYHCFYEVMVFVKIYITEISCYSTGDEVPADTEQDG